MPREGGEEPAAEPVGPEDVDLVLHGAARAVDRGELLLEAAGVVVEDPRPVPVERGQRPAAPRDAGDPGEVRVLEAVGGRVHEGAAGDRLGAARSAGEAFDLPVAEEPVTEGARVGDEHDERDPRDRRPPVPPREEDVRDQGDRDQVADHAQGDPESVVAEHRERAVHGVCRGPRCLERGLHPALPVVRSVSASGRGKGW